MLFSESKSFMGARYYHLQLFETLALRITEWLEASKVTNQDKVYFIFDKPPERRKHWHYHISKYDSVFNRCLALMQSDDPLPKVKELIKTYPSMDAGLIHLANDVIANSVEYDIVTVVKPRKKPNYVMHKSVLQFLKDRRERENETYEEE